MKIKVKQSLVEKTVAQAANELDVDKENIVSDKGDIESALDEALEDAYYEKATHGKDFPNILLVGKAGTGKTSRVRAWAAKNNINLVVKLASVLDDTDLGGAPAPDMETKKAIKLSTNDFDALDNENSVLFLDEYNRAPRSVRGTLLSLVQDHTLPDSSEKTGVRYLPNFLFTIAAINPADVNYNTDTLDDAEASRFRRVDVVASKQQYVDYMENQLNKQLEEFMKSGASNEMKAKRKLRTEGQIAIMKKLFGDNAFNFDTDIDIDSSKESGNGLILQNRSFSNLLKACNGTKEDFLKKWNQYCNSNKLPLVKQILADYEDVQDKANDLLKNRPTDSKVFGTGSGLLSKARNAKVN